MSKAGVVGQSEDKRVIKNIKEYVQKVSHMYMAERWYLLFTMHSTVEQKDQPSVDEQKNQPSVDGELIKIAY